MPLVIKSRKTLAQLRREKEAKEKKAAHKKFQMLKVPKPTDSPSQGASLKALAANKAAKPQTAGPSKAKDKADSAKLVEWLEREAAKQKAAREARTPAEKARDAEIERKWHQKNEEEKKKKKNAAAKKRGSKDGQAKSRYK